MGLLEWIAAHLLGPFVNLYRLIFLRPRVEPCIVELNPTGGGTFVDFTAYVQNTGAKSGYMTVTARVGDREVGASPETRNLLAHAPAVRVSIGVPRPDLGDLMKECDDKPTLYGETLHLRVETDGRHAERKWREEITDRQRHEIQRRYWRRARGEETADDRRADEREERLRRRDTGDDDPGRYQNI